MSGTNFGLNEDLQYYEMEFDSLEALIPQTGDASIRDWPQFQLGRSLEDVAAVKILQVEIPFTWDVFNSDNNTFSLTETVGAVVSATVDVTIPIGNYTTTTLISALETALDAASPNNLTYTVTYADSTYVPMTQKFTFTNNGGGSDTYMFTFGDASYSPTFNYGASEGYYATNPSVYLGFNLGEVTSAAGGDLTAPNIAMITGPNYLYVNSSAIGPQCQLYLPTGSINNGGGGNQGPQMAKVPVTVQPGGIIEWSDPDPLMWFDQPNSNITALDFFLTLGPTSKQTPLQLNGGSFSLKVGFLVKRRTTGILTGGLSNNGRITEAIVPAGAKRTRYY